MKGAIQHHRLTNVQAMLRNETRQAQRRKALLWKRYVKEVCSGLSATGRTRKPVMRALARTNLRGKVLLVSEEEDCGASAGQSNREVSSSTTPSTEWA